MSDLPSDAAESDAVESLAKREGDPWQALRRYTPARIALGRVGASLPTAEVLAFSMAHARARDAVHLPLDRAFVAASLIEQGFATLCVESQAADRSEYLRRPDLGRALLPACRELLHPASPVPAHRLTIVVGDGLSSLAPIRHALPLLVAFRSQLAGCSTQWELDTVFLATQARVALADQIGALRGAEAVVMMLGERPGLSSPDSLGVYLTYAPRPGLTDADRNCISNVRHEGLSYAEAAYKLHYLLEQARLASRSGVLIKDASDWQPPPPALL